MSWTEHHPLITYLEQHMLSSARRPILPGTSNLLCSRSTLKIIESYKEGKAIANVPLDSREAAEKVFEHYLLSDVNLQRRHLLCCAGGAGTGKTVLQAFNLHWFVQRMPRGLVIEVTFNDDQGGGIWDGKKDGTKAHISVAIALRVLHRALAVLTSPDSAYKLISQHLPGLITAMDSPLGGDAILMTLDAVRRLLCLPAETPVFLTIDELSKMQSEEYTVPEMMASVARLLEEQRNTLFLSISSYHIHHLSEFDTESPRPIFLQPLPPLMAVCLTQTQVTEIPLVLRVLADDALRCQLPNNDHVQALLFKVSELVMLTGGHPRRLHALLTIMKNSFPMSSVAAPSWVRDYIAHLQDWLQGSFGERHCRTTMNSIFTFSLPVAEGADFYNRLVPFAARPFKFFPQDNSEEAKRPFFTAASLGLCQFFTQSFELDGLQGFAFLPFPVLLLLADKFGHKKHLPVSLRALLNIVDALVCYSKPRPPAPLLKPQDALEQLTFSSLLMFFQHNQEFNLSALCGARRESVLFQTRLMAGSTTTTLDDSVLFFPLYPQRPWDETLADELMQKLTANSARATVFRPRHPTNLVCCLLPRADESGFVLVVVQCMDWLRDASVEEQSLMLAQWRTGKKEFTSAIRDRNGEVSVPNPMPQVLAKLSITPVFVLFSTSPISSFTTLEEDEGVIDFMRMRTWQPTTAYAAETAHRLRCLCRPNQ